MNDPEDASLIQQSIQENAGAQSQGKLGNIADKACCERFKLLCCPIYSFKTKTECDNDSSVELIIVPEAFRMWFYFGFIIVTVLAIVISLNFSTELDLKDNIFQDLYGGNFICLYFDYPPFNHFAAILWFPLVVIILMYEAFDQMRAYDAYIDLEISKTFYILYTVFTVFECMTWIASVQFMATNPEENLYWHTAPFLLLLSALWTIAFKRFMYMRKVGVFDNYSRVYQYAGWFYVGLLLFCAIAMNLWMWPNLFGARLYKRESFLFAYDVIGEIIDLWLILAVIAPIIIYFIFTKDLKRLTININSTN